MTMYSIVVNAAQRLYAEIHTKTGRVPSAIGIQLDVEAYERCVIGWHERIKVMVDADADDAMRKALADGMFQTRMFDGVKLEIRRVEGD